ncbi:glutamate racemase [Fontivita pretiosa]|uniref:glutamate racemase n=1 Tax=Fontivita pretiosa TaxID=2989684 RepID=UPI003D1770B3
MSPDSPIVVLDSGLGGLTVVRALRAVLPHDEILYFGDTARLPYGSKSATTVTTFVKQIVNYFRPRRPKHVVIACNTATALALPGLRGEFADLSISGVVEPGARAAVAAAGARQEPVIGVIATEATVRSKAYERAIHRRRNHARILLRPTPLLVPMIEEGRDARDPVVHLVLQQYLQPLLDRKIDVLLLGCTHYPLLKGLIARIVGPNVSVIDSAEACAEDVERRLRSAGLLRPGGGGEPRGSLRCFVTDDSPRFAALARHFLGFSVAAPTWVPPEELYAASPALERIRQAG